MEILHRVVVLIIMVTMSNNVSGTLHRVGGSQGWTQNVNYSQWALNEQFYVGDWLIFYFEKHMYNVLEVNKSNYEQCREQEFIANITKGGRDVYELKEARPYYFLSGGGFCWGGMKLAIDVRQVPLSPAPAPAHGSSSSSSSSVSAFVALSSLVALMFALVNV